MSTATPHIFLLPGVNATCPVYSRLLPLIENASIVDFIDPQPRESLTSYAKRMSARFDADAYIGRVSFGGILALEISRIIRPKGCILISSIRGPDQLPPKTQRWRSIGGRNCARAQRLLSRFATFVPRFMRSSETFRLARLAGPNGSWHRWATAAVLDWESLPFPDSVPTLHIHGDADTTFPIEFVTPDIVVPRGRHALSISHPEEVAWAICRLRQDA